MGRLLGVITSLNVFFLIILLLNVETSQCSPSCVAESVDTISVNFDVTEYPILCDLFYVQLSVPGNEDKPFALVTTQTFPLNISGLNSTIIYSISIRGHNASTPSISWGPSWMNPTEWIQCQTSPISKSDKKEEEDSLLNPINIQTTTTTTTLNNENETTSQFLRIYRISEYSFDVDFLSNHDGASIEAMPLYLMTCDPSGTCAPWSVNDTTDVWQSCQNKLLELCPYDRGNAFDCLDCIDLYKEEVTETCGEYSNQDTTEGKGSYSVHWYCGIGWPESTPEEGPITEYCVEYLPLTIENKNNDTINNNNNNMNNSISDNNGNGFSDYLSCNSDEVDAFGNDPRDPSCICICYDDRLISHQSLYELQRDCHILNSSYHFDDNNDDLLPWVNETSCNCANTNSPIPNNQTNDFSSYSLTYIGQTPIFLPYVGIPLQPGPRPFSEQIGYNYHFPSKGECINNTKIGDNGCTWKRLSRSRMVYGKDLINAGWNLTFVADKPSNDYNHTKDNIHSFSKAFENLNQYFQSSLCGGG